MKVSTRDNFSKQTINQLKRRVSGFCSNPTCYVLTAEPCFTDSSKVIETGIAAHICAASPLGPRYDRNMTPAARKHIDNGIWLCSHCATKIDKEPESYPVDLLHEWKKEAELRIKKNSNSKLYTEQETEHKVHKALVQAMDFRNLANIETSFSTLAKAINTHFRTLDPRLDISYSFSNNASHFEINIDEKIEDPIFIDFTPNNSFEYKEKISNLFEHGEGFSCSIEKVTTTSDGLNQLFPQNLKDGILKVLSPYKKESTIEFTDDWGNILLSLDGITTCGRSSFSIFAQKYDELINLSAEKIYYSGISNSNNFNLSLNDIR